MATDVSKTPGAKRAAMPKWIGPERATLSDRVPEGPGWVFETKLDGYRILAYLDRGKVRLLTRNGNDWTTKVPAVRDALKRLPARQAILDGELVAVTRGGGTSFQALQAAIGDPRFHPGLAYFIFDLPYFDGHDLTQAPLLSRKELLRSWLRSVGDGGILRYSDHVDGHGQQFYDTACRHSLEGIICKRADSVYRQRRTRDWLKVKCLNRQEFVIGGFTDPAGSRAEFGALLLGVYDEVGRLRYCGRVGTGFSERTLRDIGRRLRRDERSRSPFVDPPRGRGYHWTAPRLLAEVVFTEWTKEGQLRHPSFQGLRKDKDPREVRRERPMAPGGNS